MRRSIIKIAILICSIVVLIGCYNETDSPNAPKFDGFAMHLVREDSPQRV